MPKSQERLFNAEIDAELRFSSPYLRFQAPKMHIYSILVIVPSVISFCQENSLPKRQLFR